MGAGNDISPAGQLKPEVVFVAHIIDAARAEGVAAKNPPAGQG